MTVLYAATTFLGAALLFVIQPITGRLLLPMLGGSPQVWNTCIVFFQLALLIGYLYAHVSTRLLSQRRQPALHISLLLLPLVFVPFATMADAAPAGDMPPAIWLFQMLVGTAALPVILLSTSSPLLQSWFSTSETREGTAQDPYLLYAASNLGSLVALIAYPLAIERVLTLTTQLSLWRSGYLLYAALVIACALWSRVNSPSVKSSTPVADVGLRDLAPPLPWSRRARWVALAFVPSSLLLGVTTYLTTDVAAVPLLWVLPLALYLVTFVLAFASGRNGPSEGSSAAMALLVLLLVVLMVGRASGPLWLVLPVHLSGFYLCSRVLHGRLAADRPAPSHLTDYYVWIAVGGALGGVFNTFAAPLLFSDVLEYPLAVVAACALRPAFAATATAKQSRWDLRGAAVAGVLAAATAGIMLAVRSGTLTMDLALPLLGCCAVLAFSTSRVASRFSLAVASVLLVGSAFPPGTGNVERTERTFFGVYRVVRDADGRNRSLYHGTTLHGQQSLDSEQQHEPRSYYHRAGPAGQLLAAMNTRLHGHRIGAVGLGVGSLAAYAERGQHWTFYEIDPAVERIARDSRFFSYLSHCNACEVVLGDARLSLARAPRGAFGLLVLDAFSSDAIPVHLLTREALSLYLSRLAVDGVLAFHISNRHLDLSRALAQLASERGLVALLQRQHTSEAQRRDGHQPSHWMVMAPASAIDVLTRDPRWTRVESNPGGTAWTDDFSDVLGALTLR